MKTNFRRISSISALLKTAGRAGLWQILPGLLFGLISCDSMQNRQGYVVDAATGQPVPGAEYRRYNKKRDLKVNAGPYGLIRPPQTDSLGWFQSFQIVNGFPTGPRMKVRIEKKGYKPVDIKWKPRMDLRDTLEIPLEKISLKR
ncbi:carboxypeptidase-like regulatory domain-containing protein [Sinomicrobium weinanense]|uniref:Carboxypeptidase regulatory-like domain-containing protein n=1 Tax=Sinomicrobium weinanense TaxID=2842200 RepID=A0A926Q1S1_9FLAO|nr:carboxypeptidase-like regulatory domain-containing protein [Sinomicrobium weinanense]MBC9795084.1 carboxypeptidase regulatory-like domain-containing protein [Sinomicrobium weinanense]MBU3123785.1 carboxypeptidase-like regulatory domain-containing protein [Sinomicrobium weinanense]